MAAKFLVLPTSAIDAKGGYAASVPTTVVTAAGGIGEQSFYGFNLSVAGDLKISISGGSLSVFDGTSYQKVTKNTATVIDMTITGLGGLDTGTSSGSSWYYPWIIYNPTTGAVSAVASLSSSAPTLPSGYTLARRVGSFYLNAFSSVQRFRQRGSGPDKFYYWDNPEILTQIPATSNTSLALQGSASPLSTTVTVTADVEGTALATYVGIDFFIENSFSAYVSMQTPRQAAAIQTPQTALSQAVVPCTNGTVNYSCTANTAIQIRVSAWTESL